MAQIISACAILAKEHYIERRDTVCAELYCNVCKELGGNHKTNTSMATLRIWYKQVIKLSLARYGTSSVN
jgi:hypothetical protein